MNVVLGFVLLLLLGFAASRLTLFQGRFSLGTQYVFMAGTEFLLIGLIMGPRAANIITQETLRQLSPVLSLGLGWIGLLIGLQFNRRELAHIPLAIWMMGGIISGVAFLVGFAGLTIFTPWVFQWVGLIGRGEGYGDYGRIILGVSFLLAWIGTVSTCSALGLLKRNADAKGELTKIIQLLTEVRSPIAILAMGVCYCLNHSSIIRYSTSEIRLSRSLFPFANLDALRDAVDVVFPVMIGVEWLALTVLLGVALGWAVHYLTNHRLADNEMLLLLAGAVIFSGGLSSYLHLSPLFVNLVMGTTLANVPNFTRGRIISWMLSTEKPFFVIFLILVGSMWPPISPAVLGLTLLYIVCRIVGLWIGTWAACFRQFHTDARLSRRLGFAMLAQGGVALAMVMDFALIHPGSVADLVLGVVILATLVQQLFGPSMLVWVLKSQGNFNGARRKEGGLHENAGSTTGGKERLA